MMSLSKLGSRLEYFLAEATVSVASLHLSANYIRQQGRWEIWSYRCSTGWRIKLVSMDRNIWLELLT